MLLLHDSYCTLRHSSCVHSSLSRGVRYTLLSHKHASLQVTWLLLAPLRPKTGPADYVVEGMPCSESHGKLSFNLRRSAVSIFRCACKASRVKSHCLLSSQVMKCLFNRNGPPIMDLLPGLQHNHIETEVPR